MKAACVELIGRLVTRRPGAVAGLLLVVAVLSAWRVSKLHINHDQIELIPQHLPSVQATRQMIKLTGGVGFLILAIKGEKPEHLKGVADDLAERLRQLPEVRKVTHKQDVSFVRHRIALFVAPEDLREGARRLRRKVRSVLRKANPFHFELRKTEDEPLELGDLIQKYRAVNKVGIDDPYYFDPAKEMITLVIKPSGSSTDLSFCQRLLDRVEALIEHYNTNNLRGARLAQHYDGLAPGATVTYGYAGGYKTNLDDSETIRAALVPTSLVAFVGIFLYLLFFLRRLPQVLLVMAMLALSVLATFAACELTIGELNTITALLGAILMGLGIDFGIHFICRLREEYTLGRDLERGILAALEHSGAASGTSALTTAAALFLLGLSEFRGFSDFGFIAGTGVLLTFVLTYISVPTVYVLLDRVWPSFKESLLVPPKKVIRDAFVGKPYPHARPILLASAAVSVVLAYAAADIHFDYDSRSLLTVDRPSVLLAEEIRSRYDISSDPVAIYSETLQEARDIFATLTSLPDDTTVDAVVSLFSLVPDAQRQAENRKTMDGVLRLLEPIRPEMLKAEEAEQLATLRHYLEAQPYGVDDVPPHIREQFQPVSDSGVPGYLTFIYPKVTLWDGRDLIRFAEEIGRVQANGTTYYSAGMPVLFADLAQIVIRDGIRFTLFAGLAICVILIIGLRSIRAAVFAMVPLVAGMVWMLGLMALWGWRINFMNIVVFPVVFGYGISAGIHLYHRFRESGSVMLAVRRTGAAVAASSITTLVGWAALLVSDHRGLESMGVLACFGIAGALAVSVTVLPALLQTMQGQPHTSVAADSELARKAAS